MVPMWIVGLLAPALTWLALYFDILPKITTLFSFWYLPGPICSYAVGGMIGLLFTFFIFVLSWIIYYPFFKVYDRQCMQKEEEDEKKRISWQSAKQCVSVQKKHRKEGCYEKNYDRTA